jgi:hypothetical protein
MLCHLYLFTFFGMSMIPSRFISYHTQFCDEYYFKSCGIYAQIVALRTMLTQYREVQIAATPTF